MDHLSSCDSTLAASCTAVRRRSRSCSQHLIAPLKVDLSGCKYELLRLVAARLGWQVVPPGSADSAWDLYWTDTSISQERLLRLAPTQRINHFHGMLELCRKRSMAKALAAVAAAAPASACYDFFPPTWQLPNQLGEFISAAKAAGKKATFIVKPDAGCQGRGIRLVQGGSEISVLKSLAGMTSLQAVAQAYVPQPYLVNSLKFDLRVYVLVADVDPLRLYIYKEGLVRFCTSPYNHPTAKNLGCAYMHLTNYAINKHNTDKFVAPDSAANSSSSASPGHMLAARSVDDFCDDACDTEAGGQQQQPCSSGNKQPGSDAACSKWSFRQLRQHLESQGHSWAGVWSGVGQLVVKSVLSVAPQLAATYRATVVNSSRPWAGKAAACSSPRNTSTKGGGRAAVSSAAVATAGCRCFELLGFDVLLDANLKPWLIEVNHSPSFDIDSPLDKAVKGQLIMDAMKLVRIEPGCIAAAKKAVRKATQARLLAPPLARRSSLANAALCSAAGACTADARATQQTHRDAVIAARDKWQLKHLGAFERLYPVHMPEQQQPPARCAAFSPAKHQELAELQATYDQLLAISQEVQQHQHQQQSPVKVSAAGAKSDSIDSGNSPQKRHHRHHHQQQQLFQPACSSSMTSSSLDKCNLLGTQQQQQPQPQPQPQQQDRSPTTTMSKNDSEEFDARSDRGTSSICNSNSCQQAPVESALVLLSAALAHPDGRLSSGYLKRRPALAGSRQCSSSRSSDGGGLYGGGLQPPLGGSCRRAATSRPESATGGHLSCAPGSGRTYLGAGAAMTGPTDSSKSRHSTSSACSNRHKQLQQAGSAAPQACGATAAPVTCARPTLAPRLRGSSAVAVSAPPSAPPSAKRDGGPQHRARPLSSRSGRSCRLGMSSCRADLTRV